MSEVAKHYTLVFKRMKYKFPLSRFASTATRDGVSCSRRTVTFNLKHAVRFKDREDALFYIANLYDKYPEELKRLYPMKMETLLKRFKGKPLRQLRTGKILFPIRGEE